MSLYSTILHIVTILVKWRVQRFCAFQDKSAVLYDRELSSLFGQNPDKIQLIIGNGDIRMAAR